MSCDISSIGAVLSVCREGRELRRIYAFVNSLLRFISTAIRILLRIVFGILQRILQDLKYFKKKVDNYCWNCQIKINFSMIVIWSKIASTCFNYYCNDIYGHISNYRTNIRPTKLTNFVRGTKLYWNDYLSKNVSAKGKNRSTLTKIRKGGIK